MAWRRARTPDGRDYWYLGSQTQWEPPIAAETVALVGSRGDLLRLERGSGRDLVEAWGRVAGTLGLEALIPKDFENREKGVKLIVEQLKTLDRKIVAQFWDDGAACLVFRGGFVEDSGKMGGGRWDLALEGEEETRWGDVIRFFRVTRPGRMDGSCRGLVSVSVFGFRASYRRPAHYARGLLHLAAAIEALLPGFRLRVYHDASILDGPQAEREAMLRRNGASGRDIRVAQQGREAWKFALQALAELPHVDLIRFTIPALADPEWPGAHQDLTGTLIRLIPMFAAMPGCAPWANGAPDDTVVYASDADFKWNPVEHVGLRIASFYAEHSISRDAESGAGGGEGGERDAGRDIPELIGGAFGGSTAPRHWPSLGIPPIMAGQVMARKRLPSAWLLHFIQDACRGRASVVAGRYAKDVKAEAAAPSTARSDGRRRVTEQTSVLPFGADEAFLTSSLVPRTMLERRARNWLLFCVPIAVARGVMKTISASVQKAMLAGRSPSLVREHVIQITKALSQLAIGDPTSAGSGEMGVTELQAKTKEWWESPRLEWSAPYEGWGRGVCGELATRVHEDFCTSLHLSLPLYLDGLVVHTARDLEYLLQFLRLCSEGLGCGALRFNQIRIGGGKLEHVDVKEEGFGAALCRFLADASTDPTPLPPPNVPWEAPRLGSKRPPPTSIAAAADSVAGAPDSKRKLVQE